VIVRAPTRPGRYLLEVSLVQVGGPDLTGPYNPLRLPIEVIGG